MTTYRYSAGAFNQDNL